MQKFGTVHIVYRKLGIFMLTLAASSVAAEALQEPGSSGKSSIKTVADLEQLLQLDIIEFELRSSQIDWSSIDNRVATAIVERYIAQSSHENDVMLANAHQAASDAVRSNYNQSADEMNAWERRRYELYLKDQGEKQSQRLVTAIDRSLRLKDLVKAAMVQTAPILAAKGELGPLLDNPESAIVALQRAAADENHKYRFESILALKENWTDQLIAPEIVQNITASFAEYTFSKKLYILRIMVAFDDTTRAIELLSQELNAQTVPLPETTSSNLETSYQQVLQSKIEELTRNLERGGVVKTDSYDGSKTDFRKWWPSEIVIGYQDRAQAYIDLATGHREKSDRLLNLAELDAAKAKQLTRLLPEDKFKDLGELVCLELQCQALTAMFKNRSVELRGNEQVEIASRLETAFSEREQVLMRLPEQNPSDKKQKLIRTAMMLVAKAEFASINSQSKDVIDCHQKLIQLGDDYSEWGEYRIFRDAYLQENDPKSALRIVNNAMIKYLGSNANRSEYESSSPRRRRSERIQTVKQALPDIAIYWQLAEQVGHESDRKHCQNYLSNLIATLK